MKKRLNSRKMRLMRPADGLMPLAWGAGLLLAPDRRLPVALCVSWLAVRLCGLFSADGVRMAYATQPGRRGVRGSTTMALILQIAGAALAAGLVYVLRSGISMAMLCVLAAGMLLNIEHVFYEYLYAAGDRYSAGMCRIITTALFTAGMCVEQGEMPLFSLGAAGISALIMLILALGSGYRPAALSGRVFACAPRAMVCGVLYPAACAGLALLGKVPQAQPYIMKLFGESAPSPIGLMLGFCLGLALMGLARTPFRRTFSESRNMNIALFAVIALCLCAWAAARLCGAQIPCSDVLPSVCLMPTVAAVIAFALWGNVLPAKD